MFFGVVGEGLNAIKILSEACSEASVFKETEVSSYNQLAVIKRLYRPSLSFVCIISDNQVNTITRFLGQRNFMTRAVNSSPVLPLTS